MDDQLQTIAQYVLGLALQPDTGFPDSDITVNNANAAAAMLYRALDGTSLGPVKTGLVMTPSLKSQLLMFAGDRRDYASFLRACTLRNRFDCAPDQQTFVPWLDSLVKNRSMMNYWEPYLQEWFVLSFTSTALLDLANKKPKQLDPSHPVIPKLA